MKGSEERKQVELEIKILADNAYLYATQWEHTPICEIEGVLLFDTTKAISDFTGFPEYEYGELILARANMEHRVIYLCRPSWEDFFHEAYHIIYQCDDNYLAEKFSKFCVGKEKS